MRPPVTPWRGWSPSRCLSLVSRQKKKKSRIWISWKSKEMILYLLSFTFSLTLKNAYSGLFHFIFSYVLLLWGHCSSARDLFIIQIKALRILGGLGRLQHAGDAFFKILRSILTRPSLFIITCASCMWKNNPWQYHLFSEQHSYNTRNKFNIISPFHRVEAGRNGPIF